MEVRDATADRRQVVWSGRGGTHAIDGPWYGTPPTLTLAALVTSRLEISTLVAGRNFRHPVSLSRDLIGLDETSEGRLTLGVGVGAESGYDVDVFGTGAPKSRGRADELGFAAVVAPWPRAQGPFSAPRSVAGQIAADVLPRWRTSGDD
ncbi:LLM class flavin-dependent oxidoreductase [Streptomyces sp. NPDC001652]|uniref:LLM class flavin-dependent oxidoreductase n=1 Tax=Streptomyces sp. NPDC001652 TaxID=3154393 RepID=UPI0033258B3A